MAEHLNDKTIHALLMEGTHYGLPDGPLVNEYDLENSIVEQVNEAESLLLASFSPQHIDRLVAFLRVSIKTNRQFVADAYTAFVLQLIQSETSVPVPGDSQHVRTFIPATLRKSAGRKGIKKLLERFRSSEITMEEIKANPERFLQVFRPSMLTADFAEELPANVLVLYSRWSGYLEQPEWCRAKELISKVGGRLVEVHTSGHIFSADIERFIQGLHPNLIVPVHT